MTRNTSEIFLIDANTLITPYLNYYPFDFAAKFWKQLEFHIGTGSIVILDMVKREVEKGDDSLSDWLKSVSIETLIDHRDAAILSAYSKVLTYIQDTDYYNDKALTEWSHADIADPWIVATGITFGHTIITFEKFNHGVNVANPCSHPKIPNVCSAFNVKYADLFFMMRQLSFTL